MAQLDQGVTIWQHELYIWPILEIHYGSNRYYINFDRHVWYKKRPCVNIRCYVRNELNLNLV